MNINKLKEIFYNQVTLDYGCEISDVMSNENIVTDFSLLKGRREFIYEDSVFSAITFNSKIITMVKSEMKNWVSDVYFKKVGPAFIIDPLEFRILENELYKHNHMVCLMHINFIPKYFIDAEPLTKLRWYEDEEIDQFRDDKRFDNAFVFHRTTPDRLAVAALDEKGEILAMASSTENSKTMWEIGIDTMEKARGKGLGSNLVSILTKEILNRGKLPFYSTAPSHLISQRVALDSGYRPFFCEIKTREIKQKDKELFIYT